jgi:hypothetical protein
MGTWNRMQSHTIARHGSKEKLLNERVPAQIDIELAELWWWAREASTARSRGRIETVVRMRVRGR